jgi:hypothetical protein
MLEIFKSDGKIHKGILYFRTFGSSSGNLETTFGSVLIYGTFLSLEIRKRPHCKIIKLT